jgi:hypothetical protein
VGRPAAQAIAEHPAPDGDLVAGLRGVLVPFQFDLGGPVDFDQDLIDGLEELGVCELSPVRTRSFNVSYLSRYAPILRVSLDSLSLEIVGVHWKVSRWLMLYPWLGTVSLNYYFEPVRGATSTQLLRFYDALIDLIDEDYFPYLDKHGEMRLALRLKTEYDSEKKSPSRLHMGATIDRLRSTVEASIRQPRPTTYFFMNFRILYFWTSESSQDIDHHLLASLLDLRHLPASRPTDKQPDLTTEIGRIWSNGWVTAAVLHPENSRDDQPPPFNVLEAAFGLCHAQWFLCQIWISTYMEVVTGRNRQNWSRAAVEKYAKQLYSLERDLTEVANLDIMLRDPLLIGVSQFFLERLGVSRHLEDARTRLSLLTQYLRGHLEIQTSRAASRLQILFSFSAAAAIAALVPPIWPLWPVKTVVWAIVLLSLMLFAAFSIRWASVSRALLTIGLVAKERAVAVQGDLADPLALIARLRGPRSATQEAASTPSSLE